MSFSHIFRLFHFHSQRTSCTRRIVDLDMWAFYSQGARAVFCCVYLFLRHEKKNKQNERITSFFADRKTLNVSLFLIEIPNKCSQYFIWISHILSPNDDWMTKMRMWNNRNWVDKWMMWNEKWWSDWNDSWMRSDNDDTWFSLGFSFRFWCWNCSNKCENHSENLWNFPFILNFIMTIKIRRKKLTMKLSFDIFLFFPNLIASRDDFSNWSDVSLHLTWSFYISNLQCFMHRTRLTTTFHQISDHSRQESMTRSSFFLFSRFRIYYTIAVINWIIEKINITKINWS